MNQTQTTDILERLKNSSKINGAYPKDIADAIKEIEWDRQEIARLLAELEECEGELTYAINN